MTRHLRTLLLILLATLSLIALLDWTTSTILLNGFARVEDQDTQRNVQRALDALSASLTALDSKTGDWANWDDAYRFVQDGNADFINTNPTDTSFVQIHIDLIVFVNTAGQIVYAKAFDLDKQQAEPVPPGLTHYLATNRTLWSWPDLKTGQTGILLLPEGPLLIAARPILTSEGQGPSHGTLIFGRFLDAVETKTLAQTTHLNWTVARLDQAALPPDWQIARSKLSAQATTFVQPLDAATIAGYTILPDLEHNPALILRVDLPRSIYAQAQASTQYLLLALGLIGLVLGLVTYSLLTRLLDGIARRKLAEAALLAAKATLETQVAERTASLQVELAERKRAEEQLLHNAFHDALTGLPNRALFLERLGHVMDRARRANRFGFAVLFLDLDRFKRVNDSFGHTLGDQLLIATARRLERCLRSGDTVARLGGDEFVILLEDTSCVEDVKRVTNRIEGELEAPFDLEGHRIFNSASIGIVPNGVGYEQPEEVLRDADIAMYRAKAAGRVHSQVFEPTMRDDALARLDLETDLRSAVEQHEFRVHYQPIVSLERGRITGFEALLRWEHPSRGLIAPGQFIPLAEETGLILPIGEWVLREACRQLKEWQTAFPQVPPLTVNVNLSAQQLSRLNLGRQIEQILKETGLDARSLQVEITESVVMEDCELTRAVLQQLQALGVQSQIDDFGTGYSSLSYLHQFPVDTLKIDRSFISRMPVNGRGSDLVRMIIRLAREMGLQVTAEGVETSQQLAQLKDFGCEFGQGYLFSRPVEPQAASALLGIPFLPGILDSQAEIALKGSILPPLVVASSQ